MSPYIKIVMMLGGLGPGLRCEIGRSRSIFVCPKLGGATGKNAAAAPAEAQPHPIPMAHLWCSSSFPSSFPQGALSSLSRSHPPLVQLVLWACTLDLCSRACALELVLSQSSAFVLALCDSVAHFANAFARTLKRWHFQSFCSRTCALELALTSLCSCTVAIALLSLRL